MINWLKWTVFIDQIQLNFVEKLIILIVSHHARGTMLHIYDYLILFYSQKLT
jgi:hypothetical protein